MQKQLFFKLCLLLSLFWGLQSFAQLDPFTVEATPTPQTCLGNGTLTFALTGKTPGSAIAYEVYLLPNTTTPVTVVTTNTVNSLVAGDYLIIATQSLGANTNTATDTATITNAIQPLTYVITPRHVRCPGDGGLTINVTSGTAASYEIISGPVTVPPQTNSNAFNNLPVGTYQVKVTDTCGNAVVVTVQLTQVPTSVLIDPPNFVGGELPACNQISVDHFYGTVSGNQIFFPLTFEYTVFPPGGGAPIIVTQTAASGTNDNNHVLANLPFFHDQEYTYNLKVTDACGNVFVRNGNIIDKKFDFEALPKNESCHNFYFTLAPSVFKAPYTVSFISAPAGFNPTSFNAAYPTHSGPTTDYGSDSNPVPLGSYTIKITDACGHSETHILALTDEATPSVVSTVSALTCLGQIGITVGSRNIATVIITEAPQAYIDAHPPGLPDDVSEFIIPGMGFLQGNLPMGTYKITIIDECGDQYEVTETIQPSAADLVLNDNQRPGCALGNGSVRLSTSENDLVSVTIIGFPGSGFEGPLDVSANINPVDGDFYMNSLPAGSYTFQTVDNCGTSRNKTITIQGFQVVANDVELIPNCGSFNVNLHHTSNGSNLQSFWLQKYNEVTGAWGHPGTGAPYVEGSLPSNANSVFLTNNTTNINLAYTGEFRILKVFYVYSNGSAANFRCFQVIDTFEFDGAPVIDGAYSFPCANNTSEVIIDASGVGALTYEITTKNGDPFVVNNGTSNLFSGLEPGTYNFRVTDVCGSSQNFQLDINALAPIEIQADGFCEGQDSTLSVQNFTFLDYEWYKEGAPGTILSTTNVLDFPGFDAADAGEYHVTISSDNPGSCINQTLDYTIVPNALPNAGNNSTISLCNTGSSLNLATYLSSPHDAGGTWADVSGSGAFAGTTFNTAGVAQGTYQFTYTVTSACGVDDVATISIQLKDIPGAPVVPPIGTLCEGATINLTTTAVAGAVYAWTGPNNFTSALQNPVIANATTAHSGNYSLTVTVNGCASSTTTIAVQVNAVPVAGNDNNISLCNDGDSIDLAGYLSTPHDAGGTWTDMNGTGALTGSTFNTAGVAAGTYQFKYTVTGCGPDDEAIITVELKNRPAAPIVATVPPVCEGSDVQLSATAVPGAVYAWTGPGGFTSAAQSPLLAGALPAATGNYSLTVTVNGCTSPASVVAVVVNPAPQFTIDGNAAICEGQSSSLSVVPGNFNSNDATFKWYQDGVLQPAATTANIEIFEAGVYEAEIEVNGCSTSGQFEVILNTNAFTVTLEAGCIDFNYIISIVNVNDIPGASFDWTGPDGYTSTGESADITNLASGDYAVKVTNADGCSAEASITIDNTGCFIPRGISPNDDQYNQSFDLTNLDVRDLMIFNRYGIKVYEKENYKDEWFGQSEKGDLPTGTYFYVVTLSEGKQVTGWVYLQREVN
ncbi:gliding motility-associated C-terminal domain-containing protein [Flavobacterium sp. DGU11]|uniref:Gliding motility-associated C-terminal domain-containing protein n=1 Tax=Flavobacterium arundinis TaxID=3139143 RepID=A0ABU9I2R8_9FLAO